MPLVTDCCGEAAYLCDNFFEGSQRRLRLVGCGNDAVEGGAALWYTDADKRSMLIVRHAVVKAAVGTLVHDMEKQ